MSTTSPRTALDFATRLAAWETAWDAYLTAGQTDDAWEALELECRRIGERNPIPAPAAFQWHAKPAGGGPCKVCGCATPRLRAEHVRVAGKGYVKTVSVCFGTDSMEVPC